MRYIIILCVLLLFSCDRPANDASRPLSPEIEVESGDKELEKIADNARRALPIFFRNLARPEAGAGNFSVKYPLSSGDYMEQVWLDGVRVRDGIYYGRLANDARSIDGKKKGDTIVIDTDKITDWMYVQDGKIIGGASIKYLLEKTPDTQRGAEQKRILKMFE